MRKHLLFLSAAVLLIVSLTELGCLNVPNDLVMPQWDVNLNVPVVNKSYTLSDIIKNQQYISAQPGTNGDSIYVLQSDDYSETTGISQFIQVTKQTSSRDNTVGASKSDSTILYLSFPEGAEIDSAKFSKGIFAYYIDNPSLVDVTVEIAVPGITMPDGSTFRVQKDLKSMQSDTANISFAGAKYNIPPEQQQLPDFLKYSLEIVVKVRSSVVTGTRINANFYSSEFLFSTVSGKLPTKSLGTKTESFKLDLGNAKDYRNKAFLSKASLNLNAKYFSPASNPFDIEVKNLNIIGKRNDGTKIFLKDSSGSSNINFLFANGNFSKVFNQDNSNITDFISFLPDSVILNAEYIMNPNGTKGTATIQDSVNFNTNFSAKSFMAIKSTSITDTASIDLNDNDRTTIKKGKAANVTVEVENGTPLTTWLELTFTDKYYNTLFKLRSQNGTADSIIVNAANVNSNGEVIAPVSSKNTVELDSTEIDQLSNAYYVIYKVNVRTKNANTNPPPTVAIRPEDKISIKAYGGVKVKLNSSNN